MIQSSKSFTIMVTNNEAVDNFLKGKRSLAAYQFNQLIREIASLANKPPTQSTTSSSSSTNISASPSPPNSSPSPHVGLANSATPLPTSTTCDHNDPTSATASSNTTSSSGQLMKQELNSDEIAFNYAMVNLFTGCPQRASIIFADLIKRYPRNPRLWLRLSESMLATERAKMSEFDHVQQLTDPHSRDHLLKTKNKHILIKVNPNYCQLQIQQQYQLQRGTSSNFLATIKGYLERSLKLINEYNDISLLTDDVPNLPLNMQQTDNDHASSSSPSITSSSLLTDGTSLNENRTTKLSNQLSYVNPYKSISRSDLYHLKIKVQLNLAYICLCMGEPTKALNFTTQCLKSSPLGYERVLASLYHAEACILTSRIDEAIQFLNLEVLNMAKNLSQEHPSMSGDAKVIYGDEMQRQLKTGALTTVVTYNLSVAYAAKGEFNNAYKVLMRSIQPSKPNPIQITICLLYIQLQQGQLESAKRTILNNLPQFR